MTKQLIIILLFILLAIPGHANFTIMVSNNYPPYNFKDSNGKLTGFNVELLDAISALYDTTLEIKTGTWEEINRQFVEGKVDGLAGVYIDGVTSDQHTFSRSYMTASHCFFFNKNAYKNYTIETLRTARAPKVALWKNDVLIHYLLSINPTCRFIFADSYQELLLLLEEQSVDCVMMQRISGTFILKKLKLEEIIGASNERILERNIGFQISAQKPELATLLNGGLEIVIANGEYKRLYNKWLKPYNENQTFWQEYKKMLLFTGTIILLTIVLLTATNQLLKRQVRIKTEHLEQQLKLNSIIMEELEAQREKAIESDKMKSAFLANMSHEIRTPMNGILGFAELLKTPGFSEEERLGFIELIEQSGHRMLETINNILDISKIESGAEKLVIQKIDLKKLLNDLIAFFQPEAAKKNVRLILEAPPSVPVFYADQYKLNSIFTNLIKNAIKFTKSGHIKIHFSVDEKGLHAYVEDTGIGIPPEKQMAIFDHFVQADHSHSSGYEGTGLGLSIANGYAKLHEGKMWVESTPGKGSTFFVYIPNHQKYQSEHAAKAESVSLSNINTKELKIIVAEDDNISFLFLKQLLSEHCQTILRARNGIETITLLKDNPDTDLILLDLKMPKMNGFETVEKIRKFNKDICIIVQTAYTQEKYSEELLAMGCNAYITKPINKSHLLATIARCLPLKSSNN